MEEGEEERGEGIEREEEREKVYVVVRKEVKEGKANLMWVLRNYLDGNKRLVIVHVHKPATKINIMGAQFPVNQLAEEEVRAYRLLERESIHRNLNEYLKICSSQKVEAEKLVIERENTANGIVDLIRENGVTELVMGAASDWHYSRRLRAPRSKKAIFVQQKANPSCKILFACRGHLICTREPGEGGGISIRTATSSSTPSPSPRSSISIPTDQFPCNLTSIASTSTNMVPNEGSFNERIRLMDNEAGPSSVAKDNLEIDHEEECDRSSSSPKDGSDEISINDIDLYEQLKDALLEAEELKNEAYEETRRRQKAERDLFEAIKKAKATENSYLKEVRERKDAEEKLAREKLTTRQDKQQLDQILTQINETHKQRLALELKNSNSESHFKDSESELFKTYRLLESLRMEQALNADQIEEGLGFSTDFNVGGLNLKGFKYEELIEMTDGFDESVKIGEGGHGRVFKGFVNNNDVNDYDNNNVVAIKMFNHDVFQGEYEFNQTAAKLSKIRHPNLITLIGVCTEARALIYEYAPKGSLEDNFRGKNQVMPWQVRSLIASEICTALSYLHSIKPNPIIHGNLKPTNILFDSNHSLKLTDLYIGSTFYPSYTTRKSTFFFTEPEFLATGELAPASDIYSLGIILLILLTGRKVFRIKQVVQEALDKGSAHEVLDGSAGDWPLDEVTEMLSVAIRCCDVKRENRASLEEVCGVVELVVNVAKLSKSRSWSFGSESDSGSLAPSYFLCPIVKEIMKDPQIAADGFTYEAEAIKEWMDGGHDTSPMTNLKLPNFELIPNHALRSAIQEWLRTRR
ncbi:hypothetical protein LUZ60_006945 [Juncus effusus]|nr:hypothetical protein LUZ60_006945 [Juncus effusus]